MMTIAYYYQQNLLETSEGKGSHESICSLLSQLRSEGRIVDAVVRDAKVAFRTDEERQRFFGQLREFAVRHKVGLAHEFGSRRHGFCYLPTQFLLVLKGTTLQEVFPCRIGDHEVAPLDYLKRLATGQPWTTQSVRGMQGKKHSELVARIIASPEILESGLVLRGRNVQVSRDFGELGYVDLIFDDRSGQALLVEIKVKPEELDKAIGQILRHRHLFVQQNNIEPTSVRVGIACPSIPPQHHSICMQTGICCWQIPIT